ncbi:MAG: hypothetical protein ACI9WU_005095, partial [Myxococcota bacterium]
RDRTPAVPRARSIPRATSTPRGNVAVTSAVVSSSRDQVTTRRTAAAPLSRVNARDIHSGAVFLRLRNVSSIEQRCIATLPGADSVQLCVRGESPATGASGLHLWDMSVLRVIIITVGFATLALMGMLRCSVFQEPPADADPILTTYGGVNTDDLRPGERREERYASAALQYIETGAVVAYRNFMMREANRASWQDVQQELSRYRMRVGPSPKVSEIRQSPDGLLLARVNDAGSSVIALVLSPRGEHFDRADVRYVERKRFESMKRL